MGSSGSKAQKGEEEGDTATATATAIAHSPRSEPHNMPGATHGAVTTSTLASNSTPQSSTTPPDAVAGTQLQCSAEDNDTAIEIEVEIERLRGLVAEHEAATDNLKNIVLNLTTEKGKNLQSRQPVSHTKIDGGVPRSFASGECHLSLILVVSLSLSLSHTHTHTQHATLQKYSGKKKSSSAHRCSPCVPCTPLGSDRGQRVYAVYTESMRCTMCAWHHNVTATQLFLKLPDELFAVLASPAVSPAVLASPAVSPALLSSRHRLSLLLSSRHRLSLLLL